MISIDGRVQTLNMRAPDEATWQRVATLVEEAIRSAALDAELPGQVFVVRQLDIGNIARSASPQSVAVAIESAVERVTSQAVSADDPAAAAAPMIYFKDDTSVVLSLAQRVASNKPTTEWFWPSVVKGWTPNAPPERTVPLLIERAASTSGGVVTLAQVVEMLASTGVLDKLLERMSPHDGRALLETIGWKEAMVSPSSTPSEVGTKRTMGTMGTMGTIGTAGTGDDEVNTRAPQMPVRSQELVQRWVAQWKAEPRDPRAVWLGAMLLVADRPARATSGELPELVRRWLTAVVQSQRNADDQTGNDVAARAVRRDDLIADARAWLQSHPRSPLDSLFGGGPPRPIQPGASIVDPKRAERRPDDDEPSVALPDEAPVWKNPRRTDHAGFLFLVPLLTRTGLTTILANNPALVERDWTAALLLRLARRLGVPGDDAAMAWIAARPLTIAHADRSLTAEVFRAARIRLRMEAGIGMRALVRRGGAIVVTRTSIDVFLHQSDVDTNVRRAGLDTDPEFVPWLGRNLQFRYLDTLDITA